MSACSSPFCVEVDPADAGLRLDRHLATQSTLCGWSLSRTRIKTLICEGRVKIDGRTLNDPSHKIVSGASIEVELPELESPKPLAEALPLVVVHEDAHLVVVDKPAGLVVHPAAGHREGTLVNALIAHCGSTLSGIGGVARPGIVHRLDKNTSGLIVVAKSDRAHHGLAALFADHGRSGSLVREYLAFAWGVPDRNRGTVDAPLARSQRNREKITVARAGEGRHAVTHWEVAERFGKLACRLTCRLETGRTHQIRVHLSHVGHPLLGDPLYGAAYKSKAALLPVAAREALRALGRQALHAASLGFEHPVTGETLMFRSALPPVLKDLESALRCSLTT